MVFLVKPYVVLLPTFWKCHSLSSSFLKHWADAQRGWRISVLGNFKSWPVKSLNRLIYFWSCIRYPSVMSFNLNCSVTLDKQAASLLAPWVMSFWWNEFLWGCKWASGWIGKATTGEFKMDIELFVVHWDSGKIAEEILLLSRVE